MRAIQASNILLGAMIGVALCVTVFLAWELIGEDARADDAPGALGPARYQLAICPYKGGEDTFRYVIDQSTGDVYSISRRSGKFYWAKLISGPPK